MQEKVFEGYDLSPQQKHLWRLQQVVGMDQFRAWCAIQIEGKIDTQQLQHAIQLVTSRHEILRTVFHRIPNLLLPLQVIREDLSGQIVYQDLRDHPVSETDALLTVAEANLALLPVDLTQGPQFQSILLTRSDEQHTLILHLSAFHADTVTMQLIAQELCDAYSLPAADLKDAPMQYADFSAWQNDTLESDETEAGRVYWREHAPSSLSHSLPFGYISDKPATEAFTPLRAPVSLAQNIQLFLTTGSTALKTTPNVLMLAGWMVLLQRLNGHNEQLVGVTFDGRNYEELYGAVGLYARSLPISCSFDEHISFTNLVAQLQTIMQGAAEHQECFSWDQIKGRKDSSEPYFPLCFEFLEESTRLSGGGITFTLAAHSSYIDRFDIKLVCRRQQDSFHCELHYDSTHFALEDIKRLADWLQTLLAGLASDPSSPIGKWPLLSEAEHHHFLSNKGGTSIEYPRDATIQQLFEARVEQTHNHIAVVCERQSFTYAELNARANQLAHYLRRKGVGPDVLVALCFERSIEMIVGILGVLKAGGAYLPLDPNNPSERLQYMLARSHAPVLLTLQRHLPTLPAHQAHVVCLDSDWSALTSESVTNPIPTAFPANLAYVIYTSGSTGQPKGVMVTQQGLINLCYGLHSFFVDPNVQNAGLITSISFDISVNQIFPTLLFGRTLHVIPDTIKLDSRAFCTYLDTYKIHLLDGVPSYWQNVLRDAGTYSIPNALHYLLIGGEKLEQRLTQAVFTQLGTSVAIVNIYGLTEISDVNAFSVIRSHQVGQPVTVGLPLQNNHIYVLNTYDQLQPTGVTGEVCISGESLGRGYLAAPAMTAERYVVCPFEEGARMCRTGDVGRWRQDGTLEIVGRRDHQIKIRGFRIELGEIEAVLSQHPNINRAVVSAVGEQSHDRKLVAYVVSKTSDQSTISDLRGFLLTKIPDYMIPGVFVFLDTFPLTPNGKVDRRSLPLPDQAQPAQLAPYVAPRTPVEERLAGILADALEIKRVGVLDDYFMLGGHSLLATQILSRVRDTFKINLTLQDFFGAPTVAGIASVIERNMQSQESGQDLPTIHSRDPEVGKL